jgi:transcriptional regulator GlxA family with amidase domain
MQFKTMKRGVIKSHDLPFIQAAAQILQKDPARSFTVSSLALEAGINTFKLQIGFKELFNQTIYQYRINLKLEMAISLLEDTDLSIKQIAYKTGFDSRDSLSRCFRKKFNRSPKAWRREKILGPCPEGRKIIACLANYNLN